MSADPGTEWSGPWANDAQRLFRMLQQPAGGSGTDGGDARDGSHSPQSHASPAECTHCPLCQALAMIRRSGPELLDRVAEFATGLAATLRATGPAPDGWDGAGGSEGTDEDRAARAQDDPGAGPGWAASVDEVGGDAGQNAAGPGRDARSAGGPAGPAGPEDPADRPGRPLVPPMVRIDITD